MNNLFTQIVQRFKQADTLMRIIYITGGVWLVVSLLALVSKLFTCPEGWIVNYLAVPSDYTLLLQRPWTVFTYMVLHKAFFHLFFNMLCLYWFGKVFLMHCSERQLVGLYVVGGLLGAAVYCISYNIFPLYESVRHASSLMGASAAVMAIIVASAMQMPNMQMRVLLLGNVALKHIAIVTVLVSVLGITSENAGGELAHLGGALAGYLFVVFLRRGTDITAWYSRIVGKIGSWCKPKKKAKKHTYHYQRPVSDAEFNQKKADHNQQIDAILDKIKRSGYESLTHEEKETLFRR